VFSKRLLGLAQSTKVFGRTGKWGAVSAEIGHNRHRKPRSSSAPFTFRTVWSVLGWSEWHLSGLI